MKYYVMQHMMKYQMDGMEIQSDLEVQRHVLGAGVLKRTL